MLKRCNHRQCSVNCNSTWCSTTLNIYEWMNEYEITLLCERIIQVTIWRLFCFFYLEMRLFIYADNSFQCSSGPWFNIEKPNFGGTFHTKNQSILHCIYECWFLNITQLWKCIRAVPVKIYVNNMNYVWRKSVPIQFSFKGCEKTKSLYTYTHNFKGA